MKTPLRILSAALLLMVAGAQPLTISLFDMCPKPCRPPAICPTTPPPPNLIHRTRAEAFLQGVAPTIVR